MTYRPEQRRRAHTPSPLLQAEMATSTAYVAPAADDEDVAPRTLERRKSNMKKPQYIAKAASAIARNKPKEEMPLREWHGVPRTPIMGQWPSGTRSS